MQANFLRLCRVVETNASPWDKKTPLSIRSSLVLQFFTKGCLFIPNVSIASLFSLSSEQYHFKHTPTSRYPSFRSFLPLLLYTFCSPNLSLATPEILTCYKNPSTLVSGPKAPPHTKGIKWKQLKWGSNSAHYVHSACLMGCPRM